MVQLQRERRRDTRGDKNIKRELGRERDWSVSSYEDELKVHSDRNRSAGKGRRERERESRMTL